MASCDDLFQRKLALDLERQQNDAEIDRLRQIRASRAPDPSEEEYLKAQQIAEERMAANREIAAEGIDQQIKSDELRMADDKPVQPDPPVNIYAGQPVNFRQVLRNNPESIADGQAYAAQMLSMMDAQRALKPDELTKGVYSNPRRRAEMLEFMTGKGTVKGWVRAVANATAGFRNVVDDAVVVRFINDQAQEAYADAAADVLRFVEANPGSAVDPQVKRKLFNHFKVAFQAQRHYNYVRGAWGRLGQVLQGRNLADAIMELADEDVVAGVDQVADAVKGPGAMTVINETGQLTPEAIDEAQSIAGVFKALDKVQTDPAAAATQLELVINNIRRMGADPRMMSASELANARARNFNLLTKDSQLFNERTNALNFGSNAIMSVFGPWRSYFEDAGEFMETFGTLSTKPSTQAWLTNFNSVKYAVSVTRDAGSQLFMDAAFRGKAMYGNNVDTYGKRMRPVAELKADYEEMVRGGFDRRFSAEPGEKGDVFAAGSRAFRRGASLINPERHARWAAASMRLWFYNMTGRSYFLRPGLRLMGAVDNVMGFYSTAYKLRHDLEMKARKGGKQLNFAEADNPQRAMDEWIEGELQKAFYSAQPTEADILAYRNETGWLTQEMADDETIAIDIMNKRLSRKYQVPDGQQGPSGGPLRYAGLVLNDDTRAASQFSEEMRFTALPGEPGSDVRKGFSTVNQLRNTFPWMDSAVPYFTAPLSGASLTLELTGASPALRQVFSRGTKEQRSRNMAHLAMAGQLFGIWAVLSMSGLVIGNGPSDPKQRQQWLAKLRAENKKPNSIAGVQFMGGFPIIDNFFLLQDFHEGLQRARRSRFDQISDVEAVVGTFTGYLARSTALGQVQQLFEVIYGNPYQQSRFGNVAGFFAAGRGYLLGIPSGPMRSLERATNSSQSNLYRDEEWSEMDEELFERDQMQAWESRLRDFAYNYTGLAGAFGGAYMDKDWLGFDIRLPWGMDFATYAKNRFGPHEHPVEKVYQHLYYLDMLEPPTELTTRRLRGVPMTDDLQKLWNDTYGEIKGEIDPSMLVQETFTISLPTFDVTDKSGLRQQGNSKIFSVNVAKFLGQFTKGNTAYEALRALINSDVYQKMEASDAISTRVDQPPAEKRKKPAALMVTAIKRYYAELTTAKMLAMDNPPDFVSDWRTNLLRKNAFDEQGALDAAGQAQQITELSKQVEAFTDALSGP